MVCQRAGNPELKVTSENDNYVVNLGYGKSRYIRVKLRQDRDFRQYGFVESIDFNMFDFIGMFKANDDQRAEGRRCKTIYNDNEIHKCSELFR